MIEESVKSALGHLARLNLQGDVYGERSQKVTFSIMNGEIADSTEYEDMGLGIRVIKDGRIGFGYCVPGKERECILRAAELSRLSGTSGIILPEEQGICNVKTYDEKVRNALEDGMGSELCGNMIDAAVSTHKDIIPSHGGLFMGSGTRVIGNTNGIFLSQDFTAIAGGIAASIPGERTSLVASESKCSRRMDMDFEHLGTLAGDKVLSMKSKSENPSDKLPVVMTPHAMGMLLWFGLIPSFNGENVRKGKSVYQGRIDEKVAGENISIVDDPTRDWGMGSFPFDDEGVAASPIPLISQGYLRHYFYDLKEAASSDTISTGNGTRGSFKTPPQIGDRNIIITGKNHPVQQLTEGKVILVDGVMGAHTSSPASGDFSVVANPAWLVEDGVKLGRLDGLMLSGNLPGSLETMVLGDDYEKLYDTIGSMSIRMELPSIRLTDITHSG